MTAEREDPYDTAARYIIEQHPDGRCTTEEMKIALRREEISNIPRHRDVLAIHIAKLLKSVLVR